MTLSIGLVTLAVCALLSVLAFAAVRGRKGRPSPRVLSYDEASNTVDLTVLTREVELAPDRAERPPPSTVTPLGSRIRPRGRPRPALPSGGRDQRALPSGGRDRRALPRSVSTTETDPEGPAAATPEVAWLRAVSGLRGDFLLGSRVNQVGRSRSCHVVIPVPTVSRQHCQIAWSGAAWTVRSVGRNGTAVNDVPLDEGQAHPLRNGDALAIGRDVVLRLVLPQTMSPGAPLVLDSAGLTCIGSRQRNEDAFHAGTSVVAVADGVGGRPAGRVAADMCIDVLADARPEVDMLNAVAAMNAALRRRGLVDPLTNGMASTLDAARLIDRNGVMWLEGAHVGDGWVVLQEDSRSVWLTRPHTFAAQLVAARQLSYDQGIEHPEQARLVRAIGLEESVNPDIWLKRAGAGQRLVLFTDGLYGALGWQGVTDTLRDTREHSPRQACQELIDRACAGTRTADNMTVVVADVLDAARGGGRR